MYMYKFFASPKSKHLLTPLINVEVGRQVLFNKANFQRMENLNNLEYASKSGRFNTGTVLCNIVKNHNVLLAEINEMLNLFNEPQ